MNNLKTVALLGFLSALVVLVAEWSGLGLAMGLGFAAVLNFIMYFFSDKLALAASRAKPVEEHELPHVYSTVRSLTTRMGMPMPRIYIINSPQPNAFATGRSPRKAAVAVTTGILEILDHDELEGVLGHELAHVANRDILISSIAAMLAAALSIFARMAFWFGGGSRDRNNPIAGVVAILSLILAPIAAVLIRLAISRAREYQADESGATMTGRPLKLASALEKIGRGTARIPMNVNPAVSQLFIDNPLKAIRGRGLMTLMSTHPPVEERIRRLSEMASRGPVSR